MKPYNKLLLLTCMAGLFSMLAGLYAQETNLDALKSDDKRYNAIRVQSKLWKAMSATNTNGLPIKALEEALHSQDYQQRQMAAGILRHAEEYKVTRRLLEVTVEGLEDDKYPFDPNAYPNAKDEDCRHAYVFLFNAAEGVRYLVNYGHEAKDLLLKGLESYCAQKRFCCAYLLGVNGIKDKLERTTAILIPHLRDNNIPSDGCMSAAALYRLGKRTLPQLKEAFNKANDRQQRELLGLIIDDLLDPPKTRQELEHRKKRHSATSIVFDPAIESNQDNIFFWFPYGQTNIQKAIEGKLPNEN